MKNVFEGIRKWNNKNFHFRDWSTSIKRLDIDSTYVVEFQRSKGKLVRSLRQKGVY